MNSRDDEFRRIDRIICSARTREEVKLARLEQAEYLHRYPDDWDMLEEGEVLSHHEDTHKLQDIAAARVEGRSLPKPSPELLRLRQIMLQTFKCPNNTPAIIASYERSIRLIRAIPFTIPVERADAELEIKMLENRIHVLRSEMVNG